ncbi:Uncharacterized protein TCM_025612 [Theobroma cacao]|uniref:Reverse transcriptase domain-containing protein n=1 Tax=Theobroma cacao TaxID=3641 RepID=A0A061F0Q6_THECC|nr:Uncharacterized protein TCM_025612 [Theobroma cacao]
MGQLSKILELMSTDKGKRVAGSSSVSKDVQQTEANTDPVYPPGFTLPLARNASIPMPSIGQYSFFGMLVPTGPPPTYAQQRPIRGASPSDPISVPDLDDLKEQEKLNSFRKKVQRMMDESRIEFYVEASRPAVNMMAKDSTHPTKIKPLTIFYEQRGEFVENRTHAQMTIEVPKPFPYKDDKAVPWNYNFNVQVLKARKWMVESQDNATNITSVGRITRSGCCYTPEALENLKKEKGKEKEQNLREEKVQSQESIDGSKGPVTKKKLQSSSSSSNTLYIFQFPLPSKIPNNECEDDNDSGFEVNFEKDNKKEVKIGTTLVPIEKEKLIKLLHEYVNVFAWSYQDMPRLNTDIVAHKLPLKPECKLIKQKLRRMKLEMLLKIKEDVKKQFDAGFLEVAKYLEWVANIVPVPNKDGKVRMCVDYRDLNRASPKDNFPLPHIDTLVDNTTRHSMFSFMDGFSGYNQIKMALEDREKITFITMWGTFCYKVMPFGLKNAGVTYQRAMVTLFHDMMHREVEVYVDDMIVKARKTEDHATNLERLFKRLRKFQLRLNPAKCTFGVTSRKLLGFVISERGQKLTRIRFKQSVICLLPKCRKKLEDSWEAIKGSAITDFLAEMVEENYKPMEFEFPDEDLMSVCQTNEEESEEKENWKMFFDEASNALGHGIGVVLVSLEGGHYPIIAKLSFFCTNNVAEYETCVMGLQAAIERKIHILKVFGDFALVIYQLRGEWETCDSKLVRYHKFISKLIENFDKICFTHLPREENQMADALAMLAVMFKVGTDVKIQPIMINLRECPTHCSSVEEEVDGKPWYHDIVHYLKFQQYLKQSSKNDKKTIKRLAMNFFLDRDILYKRSRDQVLLRCVDSAEA